MNEPNSTSPSGTTTPNTTPTTNSPSDSTTPPAVPKYMGTPFSASSAGGSSPTSSTLSTPPPASPFIHRDSSIGAAHLSTPSKRNVGIDLGYGFVKLVDGDHELAFPSVVGLGKDIRFFSGVINKDIKLDNLAITFDGTRYFVGELAMRQSDIASRGLSQDRISDKNYRILLLTALGIASKSDDEAFSIVTGLPTSYFGAYRDELGQSLKGKYELVFGAKGFEKTKTFSVKDTYIIPQPFGTLYDQILGNNGETIYQDFNNQVVGIVDIGFKTTDFAVANQLEYIDHLSFSTMTALSDAYSMLADKLRSEFKIDKENFELDKIIMDGTIRIAGTPHDLSDFKKKTFQFVAQKIVTELESQWNYRDFDTILLAGGGGKALAEYILPHFSNMRLANDPQHSNVRGFQKIANKVYKNI